MVDKTLGLALVQNHSAKQSITTDIKYVYEKVFLCFMPEMFQKWVTNIQQKRYSIV